MFNPSKPKAMKTKLDYILSFIGFFGLLMMASIESEIFAPYFVTFLISVFFLVAGHAIPVKFLDHE